MPVVSQRPERFDTVGQIESIADRLIRQGQDRGEFDDLPGAGEPIADLDDERPAGWWADRWIATQKSLVAAEELRAERAVIRTRALNRESVSDLRSDIEQLNALIVEHNRTAQRRDHRVDPVDLNDAILVWYRLRRARNRPKNRWGLAGR